MRIAIIGSSGGIGKCLVETLSTDPRIDHIYSFSRTKTKTIPYQSCTWHPIDMSDESSIEKAASHIKEPLDLIFIAVGFLHDDHIMPEKNISHLNAAAMQKVFEINTIGPTLIAKYFLPLLNKQTKSHFIALSARVGSISDNRLGGWYSYRASKSALNMILKSLSIETKRTHPKAIVAGLHPGTVKTKLSEPFQHNVKKDKLFTPEMSVKYLLEVIDDLNYSDSGKVFAWDGQEILP